MKITDYMLLPVMMILVVVISIAATVVPVAIIISIVGYGIGLMALGKLEAKNRSTYRRCRRYYLLCSWYYP